MRINGNLYKTADNQTISKSNVICTNYYVLFRNETTVFNNHLTAERHTANSSTVPIAVLGKQMQIETTRGIIPIRKKRFHEQKKKKNDCRRPRDTDCSYFVKKKKPFWSISKLRSQSMEQRWRRTEAKDSDEERSLTYIFVARPAESLLCFHQVDRWSSRLTTHCVTRSRVFRFRGV